MLKFNRETDYLERGMQRVKTKLAIQTPKLL